MTTTTVNHDLYPAVLAAFELADQVDATLDEVMAYDRALEAWLGVDPSSFGFDLGEAEDRGYDHDRIYYELLDLASTDAALLYLGRETGMFDEAVAGITWPGPIPAVYLADESEPDQGRNLPI